MSDLPNLDAARAALKAFHESGRQIVVDRLSGRRKAAPMNRHLPNCERYLSDALAVVDALTARLTEAEATLANERGEGEPPSEGWEWTGECWTRDLGNNEQARVSLDATGLDTEVPRWRCFLESADDWTGDFIVPSAPTARAAMRDADSALAAKVTP